MASSRGFLNIQSLNELTYEKRSHRTAETAGTRQRATQGARRAGMAGKNAMDNGYMPHLKRTTLNKNMLFKPFVAGAPRARAEGPGGGAHTFYILQISLLSRQYGRCTGLHRGAQVYTDASSPTQRPPAVPPPAPPLCTTPSLAHCTNHRHTPPLSLPKPSDRNRVRLLVFKRCASTLRPL
jgi:hypothetical protein